VNVYLAAVGPDEAPDDEQPEAETSRARPKGLEESRYLVTRDSALVENAQGDVVFGSPVEYDSDRLVPGPVPEQ
jgi:hypothetical protein